MNEPRLYTVEEAQKTLPFVKRVVEDIVQAFERRSQMAMDLQRLGGAKAGTASEDRAFALENSMHACEAEILRYQQELDDLGIELKDYRIGLIDFFSRYKDRIVYLCWKLDDGPALSHWHELDAGFRGRQALTPKNREQFLGRMRCEPGTSAARPGAK